MTAALVGALASAALLGIACTVRAPLHLLAFVAMTPWLVGLERAGSLRAALASAALLAAGMAATVFWWFPEAIARYTGGSTAVAWLILLALAPVVLEPQLLAYAAFRHLAARGRGVTPAVAVAASLLYVGAEWALPKLFSDTLGAALYPSERLRQVADLAGVRGLTLLVILSSEALAALLARRRVGLAVATAALVAGAALYGTVRLDDIRRRTAAAPSFTAGVVQANITAYDKLAAERGTYEAVVAILDAHLELSRRLLGERPLDLLVWPETVYPTTLGKPKTEDARELDAAILGLPRATGVPLVLGAFDTDAAGEYNAAFFVAPDGALAIYRKALLFPMTERLPAWLDGEAARRAMPWTGRWRPGPGPRVVTVPVAGRPTAFAPLICYEALDAAHVAAEARRGARVLLVLSNDGWFTEPGARLHLVTAAFRSVETRRAMLRATNSGISALVLPDGAIVDATRFGEVATLRARVPLPAIETPIVVWGDFLGPVALGMAFLALAGRSIVRR
jgi:apolipoprotein N-acyltransferase